MAKAKKTTAASEEAVVESPTEPVSTEETGDQPVVEETTEEEVVEEGITHEDVAKAAAEEPALPEDDQVILQPEMQEMGCAWTGSYLDDNGELVTVDFEDADTTPLMDRLLSISSLHTTKEIELKAFGFVRLKAKNGDVRADFDYSHYAEPISEEEHLCRKVFNAMIPCRTDGIVVILPTPKEEEVPTTIEDDIE